MDKYDIENAIEGKFTDFSKAVKDELHSKLSSHEISVDYKTQFDSIKNMKQQFTNISGYEE